MLILISSCLHIFDHMIHFFDIFDREFKVQKTKCSKYCGTPCILLICMWVGRKILQIPQILIYISFRKKSSSQIKEFCDMSSTPRSVFKFSPDQVIKYRFIVFKMTAQITQSQPKKEKSNTK